MRAMMRSGAAILLFSLAACGSSTGKAPSIAQVTIVPVAAAALSPMNEVGSADPLDGAATLRVTVSGPGMADKSIMYNLETMDSGALPEFEGGYSRQVMVEFCASNCDPTQPNDILSRGRSGLVTLFRGDSDKLLNVFVSRRNSMGVPYRLPLEAGAAAVPSRLNQANRVGATVTELDDGRLLIVGGARPKLNSKTWWKGTDLDQIYTSAEIFDPRTGEFTPTGDLNAPRAFHQAVKLGGPNRTDGRVVILGGYSTGNKPTATIEIFNPDTNSFVQLTETLGGGAGRALFTAALAYPDQNVIFYAGGYSDVADASKTWDLYIVQVEGRTGPVAHGDLASGPRWNHGMSYVPNYGGTKVPAFILFGGENDTGTVPLVEPFLAPPAPDYDFAGKFLADESAQPELPAGGRTLLQSVYVPQQGIIYVIGGFGGKDLASPSNRVDAYWVGERNFREGQYLEMSTPRGAMSATLMNANAILIAGGIGDNGALSSTELVFEDTLCDPPGSNSCYYTPKVAGGLTPQIVDENGAVQARAGLAAIFDKTQRVLLLGGLSGTGSDLPALYYNPD